MGFGIKNLFPSIFPKAGAPATPAPAGPAKPVEAPGWRAATSGRPPAAEATPVPPAPDRKDVPPLTLPEFDQAAIDARNQAGEGVKLAKTGADRLEFMENALPTMHTCCPPRGDEKPGCWENFIQGGMGVEGKRPEKPFSHSESPQFSKTAIAPLDPAVLNAALRINEADLKDLKTNLTLAYGHPGEQISRPVTGQTIAGIMQVQRAHQMPITGIYDQATMNALKADAVEGSPLRTANSAVTRLRNGDMKYLEHAQQPRVTSMVGKDNVPFLKVVVPPGYPTTIPDQVDGIRVEQSALSP